MLFFYFCYWTHYIDPTKPDLWHEVRLCTDLVGCMLSCCCHWFRCHYCSSWCYSPCDWHMHLANCQAATAGLEVHPYWEGQVCNKEDHGAVNQTLLFSYFAHMIIGWRQWVFITYSRKTSPPSVSTVKVHPSCWPSYTVAQRNKNITHLPALHTDSPLWYATAKRNKTTIKPWWAVKGW